MTEHGITVSEIGCCVLAKRRSLRGLNIKLSIGRSAARDLELGSVGAYSAMMTPRKRISNVELDLGTQDRVIWMYVFMYGNLCYETQEYIFSTRSTLEIDYQIEQIFECCCKD